jgi:hypothetical protein
MRLNGHLTCDRCGASAHDAIDEWRGEVLAECCFCGAMEWCKAPKRLASEPATQRDTTEFRFKFGRFIGMTLAEADTQPNGRKYLEHLAIHNDTLRERIAEYLKAGGQRDGQGTGGEAAGAQRGSGV